MPPTLAIGYVVHNAACRGNLHTRTDDQMISKPDAATEHGLVADNAATGNAAMRSYEAKSTDAHIMRNLHQIIDLGASPMTVSSSEPRSTVVFAPISTLS